ncbi:hypothetical protein [Alkalihalobacterium alkalinitrilicum]|uniref:hypothetical protein n=1 Tax=Alkalihalobacterium alkalinitrilicum TaxID=427920 RepID=UPI000994B783|nr:hypothetical protein [Alkalihalobacterium alkalinitrilicum]
MIKKIIIAFVLGIILTVLLSALRLNPIIIYFIIILVILFIVLYIPHLLPAYVSKNEKRVERFILKNKQNPQVYLFFALANKLDEDVKDTITELLEKNKAEHHRALYQTILHFYNQNYIAAKESLEGIKPEKIKEYYKIGVEMETGSLEKAAIEIDKLKEGWVKYSLQAELQNKKGDQPAATHYANLALERTRGLQWYLLYCEYKREYKIENQ